MKQSSTMGLFSKGSSQGLPEHATPSFMKQSSTIGLFSKGGSQGQPDPATPSFMKQSSTMGLFSKGGGTGQGQTSELPSPKGSTKKQTTTLSLLTKGSSFTNEKMPVSPRTPSSSTKIEGETVGGAREGLGDRLKRIVQLSKPKGNLSSSTVSVCTCNWSCLGVYVLGLWEWGTVVCALIHLCIP
jgi:hypothetical protein